MTTIGTFFKNGNGYQGLISTATVQGCAKIIPNAQEPGIYLLIISECVCGHARADADGLAVTIDAALSPAAGWARLTERDGYYVLSA